MMDQHSEATQIDFRHMCSAAAACSACKWERLLGSLLDTMRLALSLHGLGQSTRSVNQCSTHVPPCRVLAPVAGVNSFGHSAEWRCGQRSGQNWKVALLLALAGQQMRLGLNHPGCASSHTCICTMRLQLCLLRSAIRKGQQDGHHRPQPCKCWHST